MDIASITHRPAALFKWGKDSIHRLSAVTLHPAQSVHADRGSVHRLLRRTTLPRPFCPCRDGQETTIEARMSHTFRPSPEERAHMTLRHCVSSRPLYPRGHGQRSQAVAPHHFTPPVLSKPARAHPHNVASSRFPPALRPSGLLCYNAPSRLLRPREEGQRSQAVELTHFAPRTPPGGKGHGDAPPSGTFKARVFCAGLSEH